MSSNNAEEMELWSAATILAERDPVEVQLSRGFLRCSPTRWFPGLAAFWVPLLESLGAEVRIRSVTPYPGLPVVFDSGFVALLDDEPLLVAFEPESIRPVLDAFAPQAPEVGREVLLEYLSRRLLFSAVSSWSGPQQSSLIFNRRIDPHTVSLAGSFRIAAELNGLPVSLWIGGGVKFAGQFDALWRRQLITGSQLNLTVTEGVMELTELFVPPTRLSEYLAPETVIDLEIPVQSRVVLRCGKSSQLTGRMFQSGGRICFESASGVSPVPAGDPAATRLSIVLARAPLTPVDVIELSQPGACFEFSEEVSPRVELMVQGERVGEGELFSYQGRFAVKVQ